MEDAAFWVGPPDDPDRYRLTHLLGSGGEGEVWRAVRTDGTEVAIKIDAVPETANDGWEARLAGLSELRVTGLVQVREAFTGGVRHRLDDAYDATTSHRYVVMDHVEGLTLRTWLDEHPDASPRQRIRILRGVARTLTALHRGPGSATSITHGDVKPTNVIIDADGRPVLVDLGLLRPAGSGPVSGRSAAYSSPELRNPDATPSPRADTFSFAVTAMETLTALTPPLDRDGNLDLGATRERVARDRGLRLRPVLRQQLLRSLTPEPRDRPPTPVRVFAGRTAAAVLVPALVLGAGSSAFALRSSEGERSTAAPKAPIATPTPTPPSPTVKPPTRPGKPTESAKPTPKFRVVQDNGEILGGALTGGYAYQPPDDCGPSRSNVLPEDQAPLSSWGGETFGVTLSSKQDLRVLSVKRKPIATRGPSDFFQAFAITCPRDYVPPTVVEPPIEVPCTKKPKYRQTSTYKVDADKATWSEVPENDKRSFGVQDYRCYGDSELTFDIDDCHTNVDYAVTLTYKLDSDPRTLYQRTFKVMHLRARATSASFVTSLERTVRNAWSFTGGPSGCPGVAPVPYGLAGQNLAQRQVHETYELIFHGVSNLRKNRPNLTRTQAVNWFLNTLAGNDRYVRGQYTAPFVLAQCTKADQRPSAWRYDCGDPDQKAS